MTRNGIIALVISIIIGIVIGLSVFMFSRSGLLSPVGNIKPTPTVKPLEKYSFENLQKRIFTPGDITIDKVINDAADFTSYLFYYDSDGKKVSGLLILPKKEGRFPVILQLRGYIDQEKYTTGMGTIRSGEVFAQNGFITLAPDFLGYGQSASPSADAMESRLENYTAALNLLSSITNLNQSLKNNKIDNIEAETDKIGLWGHSNGGHITLSVLAITGKDYPAVLWNPVSKPFPYSILYYTDELADNGKFIRDMLSNFEKDYDIELYNPVNYYKNITAPIQLHQAVDDEAVPVKWSNQLYQSLKNQKTDISYFTYPGDNHDFNQGSWSKVVERNIAFYKELLAK
ncbi:prolyl oligopeptidase family serine peptidase [Candidatus Microgenomates bacterium]|nr:prolyl oligopeptidase family serine peptidase [Candidatus Microgenomates bacterium]